MQLTVKQNEYIRKAQHRWNVKSGATRSGKTFMDIAFVIPNRIRERIGKDGLCVFLGNTQGTLQRNIIEPLQAMWGTKLVGNIRSDNTAKIFGEKVYCLGADKANQVDRIRGASIKYCYGDEVVTWHKDVFDMLKTRLDKECSCFDGTCNPDNSHHWFKEFLSGDADIYLQEYQIYDNPYLPPNFVPELERELRGTVFFDRYILGKWVLAEGLIYPDAAKGLYTVPTPENIRCTEYYVSIDYGTLNPCSMGLWGKNNGVWYRLREYYYSGRDSTKAYTDNGDFNQSRSGLKTDEEYYTELVKLISGLPVQAIIVDPSAASFITTIQRHGRYSVRKARNSVLDGIRNTAVALSSGKIKICDCCKAATAEFNAYRWDDKADEDKPIKENDHAMDDIRYFVNTIVTERGGRFINITT